MKFQILLFISICWLSNIVISQIAFCDPALDPSCASVPDNFDPSTLVDPTKLEEEDRAAQRANRPGIIIGQNLTGPSRMGPFGLKNWNLLQLPGSINLGKGKQLTTVSDATLQSGYQNAYFYVNKIGDGYVFNTVIGTYRAVYFEGSRFARTELSETDQTNATAAWNPQVGTHQFELVQSVQNFTSFVNGRAIIMQMKSNLCAQCVDAYVQAEAKSNPRAAQLTVFFPQASTPTKPIEYLLDGDVQLNAKFTLKLLVQNGKLHFFYNSKEFTPKEGVITNDTSAFFKFGSWAQTRPYEVNPRGSSNVITTHKATASHVETGANGIGTQQVIPLIPGVTTKGGALANALGTVVVIAVVFIQLIFN